MSHDVMKVTLAGYNVEADAVRRLGGKRRRLITPEVISASYARISRDPRSIASLRRRAREEVEEARRSNERIVFGLGHASIAEHAVFNFDIMGISRLALETLEQFRLASFTEKSQRYIRLGRDLIVPEEIRGADLALEFKRYAADLHDIYETLFARILATGEREGVAKEDARYVMPLASSAQLGMTVNARELEYMIARLAAHPLAELRTLAQKLSSLARQVAPSLVRYPEPTDYFLDMPRARREIACIASARKGRRLGDGRTVRLIDSTPDGDTRLAAILIFSARNVAFARACKLASRLRPAERRRLILETMRSLKGHDGVWREFEGIELSFETVVSSSCFAQLKRHRMATLIVQRYDLGLDLSVPPSVREARAVALMRSAAARAETLYRRLERRADRCADYALLNAHRRRVLIIMNMRELYHFSRLRCDRSAQWEIRSIAERMCRLAERKMPCATALLGGKDRFDEMKRKLEA